MDERRVGVGPFFLPHVRRLEASGLPQDRFLARSIRELFSSRYGAMQSEGVVGLKEVTNPLALYFVATDETKYPKACLVDTQTPRIERTAVERFREKIESLPGESIDEFLDVYAELLRRRGLQTLAGIILTQVRKDAPQDVSVMFPKFIFTPENISALLNIPQTDPKLSRIVSIVKPKVKDLASMPAVAVLKRYPPGHGEAFYFAQT